MVDSEENSGRSIAETILGGLLEQQEKLAMDYDSPEGRLAAGFDLIERVKDAAQIYAKSNNLRYTAAQKLPRLVLSKIPDKLIGRGYFFYIDPRSDFMDSGMLELTAFANFSKLSTGISPYKGESYQTKISGRSFNADPSELADLLDITMKDLENIPESEFRSSGTFGILA